MKEPTTMTDAPRTGATAASKAFPASDTSGRAAQEPATGELVRQVSEQISRLVRDELALAKVEMTQKGKRAGVGAGLLGGAGVVALYGVAALLTAVVLALG